MPKLSAARLAQQEAFQGFLNRCPDASQSIVEHLTPLIRALCRKKFSHNFHSEHEVEDFTSEVWVRLSELKPSDYNPESGALSTFVFYKMREALRRWRISQGLPPRPPRTAEKTAREPAMFSLNENDHDRGEHMRLTEVNIDAKAILAQAPPEVAEVLELEAYSGLTRRAAAVTAGIERTAFYRAYKTFSARILLQAA